MSQEFDEYCVSCTFKGLQIENIYNYIKFTNVSRVKYAVYPLYLTGNIADSTVVHRKPRKKYRPDRVNRECKPKISCFLL